MSNKSFRRSEIVSAFTWSVRSRRTSGLIVNVLLVIVITSAAVSLAVAQTEDSKEFWPAVQANIDLRPRLRLKLYGEKQNGEELPEAQWKAAATVSYRMKALFRQLAGDIDSENQYLLTVAAGYEYIRKSKNGQPANENRLIIESTARYSPGAGFLFLNRNRLEFRWNDGTYDFRYRFKLTGQRALKANRIHFTPYASGELFWDRNHHSWNENQYAFGVQLPYKRRFMLDTYVLHQNCTTCGQHSVNALGITLNLYFRRAK